MPVSVGIDLGTEFCRVAMTESGDRVRAIASQQQQSNRTPTGIGFADGWLWGWSASDSPGRAAWDLKQRLGEASIQAIRGRHYSATDLLHEFLRHLRWDLVEVLGNGAGEGAALTVPYSFGLRDRETLRATAENAGFSICGLINEPEAALLGYGIERFLSPGDPQTVVVFDAGASATKVSVLEVSLAAGEMRSDLLMHVPDGRSFRTVQRQVLVNAGVGPMDAVPPSMWAAPLTEAVARAAADDTTVTVDLKGERHTVERESVRAAVADWRLDADAAVSRALGDAGLQPRDVDLALAVGGPCRIPQVRNTVGHFSRVLDPPSTASADSICARGAARYAALVTGGNTDWTYRSAETPAIGVELADGRFHPILDVNHQPDAADFRVYSPCDRDGDILQLQPLEGFCRAAAGNWPLTQEPVNVRLSAAEDYVLVQIARERDGEATLNVRYGDEVTDERLTLR